MSSLANYALGYSSQEERRLVDQAGYFGPLTEDAFRYAGLTRGMHVLDIGCGVGDVAMLAARMVGPQGSVLAIDRAETSLETARRRARNAKIANVAFSACELDDFQFDETFDAIVGRLILLYLRDPSATIKRLSARLRPGGIVVFQEVDLTAAKASAAAPLFERTIGWIKSAFTAGGVPIDMGRQLPSIFIAAGLPRPRLIAAQRVESGGDTFAYNYICSTVRSLLPLIVRHGIATADDIGIDSLADRLCNEAANADTVVYMPRLVAAWAQKL
jgi:SAM-dependent methyltransferase